ncbi:Uncharacterised protein [Shigella flexneri]|nr:Uncharacterised protein [Shigella flexneri]
MFNRLLAWRNCVRLYKSRGKVRAITPPTPVPIPCIALAAINTVKLEVVTATSVASIKMDIPTRITGRRPTRSDIGP